MCLDRTERSSDFLIQPLALYMLAVAQPDASEEVFFPYIDYSGWIIPPHYFQGFYKGAAAFGHPSFINKDAVAQFIGSQRKDRARNAGSEAVKMIYELRYTMTILAQRPILVDTGQYQLRYQNRTFADMENEIARNLTNQRNFQAKVKLLSDEHVIKTKNAPLGLAGSELAERIARIQAQTRSKYCTARSEVERQIYERQERLRLAAMRQTLPTLDKVRASASEAPPPAYYPDFRNSGQESQ